MQIEGYFLRNLEAVKAKGGKVLAEAMPFTWPETEPLTHFLVAGGANPVDNENCRVRIRLQPGEDLNGVLKKRGLCLAEEVEGGLTRHVGKFVPDDSAVEDTSVQVPLNLEQEEAEAAAKAKEKAERAAAELAKLKAEEEVERRRMAAVQAAMGAQHLAVVRGEHHYGVFKKAALLKCLVDLVDMAVYFGNQPVIKLAVTGDIGLRQVKERVLAGVMTRE